MQKRHSRHCKIKAFDRKVWMIHGTVGHARSTVFNISKLALTYTSKATWGYARQMLIQCFRGGQSYCHWGERMDKKAIGLPWGLTGMDSGRGKRRRVGALVVCAKIKRCVSDCVSRPRRDVHVFVRCFHGSEHPQHLKESKPKQFFRCYKTPRLHKSTGAAGGPELALSSGQKACQSSQRVRRVVKIQTRAQWLTRAHTYAQSLSGRMHG